MTEAVKPATDKTANSAVETDASKKEKSVAEGAHDKLVADSTSKKPEEVAKKPEEAAKKPEEVAKKPEEVAKKPEEAAKKPEEVAKKPEEVAKKPEEAAKKPEEVAKKPEEVKKTEEKTWYDRACDEVRESSMNALMGLKPVDKTHEAPPTEIAAKKGEPAVLDLSTPIDGYSTKKIDAAIATKFDSMLDSKVIRHEHAKNGTGIFGDGWFNDTFDSIEADVSSALNLSKDTIKHWTDSELQTNFKNFSSLTSDGSNYSYIPVSKDNDTAKILVASVDGSSQLLLSGDTVQRIDKHAETTVNRKTKEIQSIDKETGDIYDRSSSGSEVITKKDGRQYVDNHDHTFDMISNGVQTRITDKDDLKMVEQQFKHFHLHSYPNKHFSREELKETVIQIGESDAQPGDVTSGKNALVVQTEHGYTVGRNQEGNVVIRNPKGTVIDYQKDYISVEGPGGGGERVAPGTESKLDPSIKYDPVTKSLIADGLVVDLNEKTKMLSGHMTDSKSKETLDINVGKGGETGVVNKDKDGHFIEGSTVGGPEGLWVQKNAQNQSVASYKTENHTFAATDGSFKFSDSGTELFGGTIKIDTSGEVTFADGYKLSSTASTSEIVAAKAASSAAASSASSTAISAASSLSSKAGNPATISAGDLSACYGAYGDIVSAMNACLSSGNFDGFASCLSAKGALESAIGVITPKLAAMDNASHQGLSAYEAASVGQNVGSGGSMTTEQAIAQIRLRQQPGTEYGTENRSGNGI